MNADGYATFAIGMAGTDDGHRETVVAVFTHQQLLACNLVARILPVRIGQRRTLGDDMICRRLVVGRGRRDIDILPCTSAEQPDVAFHL